jgi:hypothetical protein
VVRRAAWAGAGAFRGGHIGGDAGLHPPAELDGGRVRLA